MMNQTNTNTRFNKASFDYLRRCNVIHGHCQVDTPSIGTTLYVVLSGESFTKLCTTESKALIPLKDDARAWADFYKARVQHKGTRLALFKDMHIALTWSAPVSTNIDVIQQALHSHKGIDRVFTATAHVSKLKPDHYWVSFKGVYFDYMDIPSNEVESIVNRIGNLFHSPKQTSLSELIHILQRLQALSPSLNRSAKMCMEMYEKDPVMDDMSASKEAIAWLKNELRGSNEGYQERLAGWETILAAQELNHSISQPRNEQAVARQRKI